MAYLLTRALALERFIPKKYGVVLYYSTTSTSYPELVLPSFWRIELRVQSLGLGLIIFLQTVDQFSKGELYSHNFSSSIEMGK